MAWHYLRAAVFQRWRFPVFGELPVNLAALAAFGVMGMDNPVFWVAGGGFEAVWLALTAGRAGYRRKVDAERRREAWKRVEERRLALYYQLPATDKARHLTLRAACRELSRTPPDSDPEATAELYTWLHLKLLLARATLAAGRALTADDDLYRLRAQAAIDISDPAAARLADHAVSLLESRERQAADSAARLAHIDAHLAGIESEIAIARQRQILDRTPFDFRYSLSLARDRMAEDLSVLPPVPAFAEVDGLLTGLTAPPSAFSNPNGQNAPSSVLE